MYMGWATPALMGLIWTLLPSKATKASRRLFQRIVGATFAAAILCYPLFLLFGYTPVQMGPVRMPIAAAASGLNILCWYAFVGLYAVRTWGLARTGPLRIWDVALSLLTVSTLGAWGIGVLHGFDVYGSIWTTAAIHFYLDLFSEGWFVLGVLGVMVGVLGFVSVGLAAGARVVWRGVSVRGLAAFYGAIGLMLGSLGVLVWPGGEFAQRAAAWIALLPLLAAVGLLVEGTTRKREDVRQAVRPQ